jgi:hypothetical protein
MLGSQSRAKNHTASPLWVQECSRREVARSYAIVTGLQEESQGLLVEWLATNAVSYQVPDMAGIPEYTTGSSTFFRFAAGACGSNSVDAVGELWNVPL